MITKTQQWQLIMKATAEMSQVHTAANNKGKSKLEVNQERPGKKNKWTVRNLSTINICCSVYLPGKLNHYRSYTPGIHLRPNNEHI